MKNTYQYHDSYKNTLNIFLNIVSFSLVILKLINMRIFWLIKYLNFLYQQILYNIAVIKIRINDMARSNIELLNFYIDSDALADAKFRLRLSKLIWANHTGFKICELRLQIKLGNIEAANNLIRNITHEEKSESYILKYLEQELLGNSENKTNEYIYKALEEYLYIRSGYELNMNDKLAIAVENFISTHIENNFLLENDVVLNYSLFFLNVPFKIISQSPAKEFVQMHAITFNNEMKKAIAKLNFFNIKSKKKTYYYKQVQLKSEISELETAKHKLIFCLGSLNYSDNYHNMFLNIYNSLVEGGRLFLSIYDDKEIAKFEHFCNPINKEEFNNFCKENMINISSSNYYDGYGVSIYIIEKVKS